MLAATAMAAAVSSARAADNDLAIDSTRQLMHRAYVAARDGTLGQSAESAQVITFLRSSGDRELLPFFHKLRKAPAVENQVYGMVAETILAKQSGLDPESPDFNYLDLDLLLSSKDQDMIGAALAGLIDAEALSVAQLHHVVAKGASPSFRAMAAGELNRIKKLDDRTVLPELLKNEKEIVKYYTAMTMLAGPDAEHQPALDAMKEMTDKHDLHQAPIQALMLVRMQKENITGGLPWAIRVASDEQCDEGLRYTAITTVLSFKAPEGQTILADMIQKLKEPVQQVKLGLIATEYSAQLNAQVLQPIVSSKSALARTIAAISLKGVQGTDFTPDLLTLLKEGHPIVLDWSLAYAERAPAERRLAIRSAIVGQATIVDGIRDRDFERAALATQKILADDGDAGRQIIASYVKSENRSVAEATLAGIFRSDKKNLATLIPANVWKDLTNRTTENAANYAAIVLGREGHPEAADWLATEVPGGTSQGPGIRVLAGWYYAKLKGQEKTLLAGAIADDPAK